MPTESLTFSSTNGTVLDARLDLPEPGAQVIGHAVFAHCFTCNKNLNVVRRVSDALTGHGLGVLRFDFTGLGQSAGAFDESHFEQNTADLHAACAFMADRDQPVRLLVGHSLGGAAVLRVANDLPDVRAIATIGAPADPRHVKHLFRDPDFDDQGKADVEIGGRPFTISRDFVDALDNQKLEERVAELRRPLMVFHSPVDRVVGIEHAERIFKAARHPKSFVSLGQSDHMVSKTEDAKYLGHVLGTWASFAVGG